MTLLRATCHPCQRVYLLPTLLYSSEPGGNSPPSQRAAPVPGSCNYNAFLVFCKLCGHVIFLIVF